MPSRSTRRIGYDKNLGSGIAAVPAVDTVLSSKDTMFFQLTVSNPTASGITLTVKDNQASPNTIVSTTVPANQWYTFNAEDGALFLGGMRWSAGGAGLFGEIYALVKVGAPGS